MAPPKASASLKKKDGVLSLSEDRQSVSWAPVAPPGSSAVLTIPISQITNLQQTPASSPKVALKIFVQPPASTTPETHVFSFTSPSAARAEADGIRDALSSAIQSAKSGAATPAAPGVEGAGGQSAAMAIASALSSKVGSGRSSEVWYDDAKLKADVELQQSLLRSDANLQKTFMEALRTKPESITNSQFTSQFWSTRLQLLRAHAIEKSQTRGAYNVLSAIKPKTIDNATRLSISKEQIQLIFSQYPLVKRVYDENVPKFSEETFWSRFFQSRLFKKLKGERIGEMDPTDPTLDKYLYVEENEDRERRLLEAHVPHVIDLEGNEQNHSQRRGNLPDLTMRPTSVDKVPIIRTLNSLSEKIMAQVVPVDAAPADPSAIEEEYNELLLRDLQGDPEQGRIILNIKDQQRFFSNNEENKISDEAALYAKQDPDDVLAQLSMDLDPSLLESDPGRGLDLERAIGTEVEMEDEPDSQQELRVGSNASIRTATSQIVKSIHERRSQTDDFSSVTSGFSTVQTSTSGLTPALFDRLSLTHATTTEFLHYFWTVFLSGDPDRAGEIAKMVESLNRAMDRVNAVANDAEEERKSEIEKLKKQLIEYKQRTGKRMNVSLDSVGGGAKVVNEMLQPTIKAVGIAIEEYKKALAAEGLEAA